MEDEFGFISDNCKISLSQEEHLDNCSFFREIQQSPPNDSDSATPNSTEFVICSISQEEEDDEHFVTPEEHLHLTPSQNNPKPVGEASSSAVAMDEGDAACSKISEFWASPAQPGSAEAIVQNAEEVIMENAEEATVRNVALSVGAAGANEGSSSAVEEPVSFVTIDDLLDDGNDNDDLLVASIKAGIKFPRPHWWGVEGYGRRRFRRMGR